ncbi:c-type cytochrome [Yunchengibacter salinarum]|uniref:c-type cytochrome n=1 Tax=Yunchengibacter salinarum TaxID=3133399 RepID=UPI0035B5CFD9
MKKTALFALTGLALGLAGSLPAAADGDPAKGKRLYMRCKACHALEQGVNKIGPSLHDLFGRKAGSVEGFRYSKAMKNADITWNAETISAYLENPRKYIPGNRMSFAGLRKEQDREDVIAYLKQEVGGE